MEMEELEKSLYKTEPIYELPKEYGRYYCSFNPYSIKEILLLLGLWFTNPVIPDFGIQLAVSTAIGLALPEKVVKPIYRGMVKIPGLGKAIRKFEEKLEKHKKIKHMVPRILAGYAVTYGIGAVSLLLYFLL